MRCKILLSILLVVILLANFMEMAEQDTNPRQKHFGIFYKVKPKCSKTAPKAIKGVTTAKDAGDEHIKLFLSKQANLAKMAADATLERKKQLLDMLLDNLAEKKEAIEEVQQAIAVKTALIKTVSRIRDKTRQSFSKLQGIYKEEMATMERMAANARQMAMEKRNLVEAATCRVEKLLCSSAEALAILDRNKDMAEKANSSAAEARKRIRTMLPGAD